jgi:hypothetical protein
MHGICGVVRLDPPSGFTRRCRRRMVFGERLMT